MSQPELNERPNQPPRSTVDQSNGYVGTPPLRERPALSAPGAIDTPPVEKGRPQPLLGLLGLVVIVPLFFVLTFAAAGPETSLEVLLPLTTFGLPIIAMIAFWWEDWPGTTLRPGWSGLTDTLIVVVGAIVLTILGQAIARRVDLAGIFESQPGAGHFSTFSATLPLAVGVFTAMLQLTMVNEGWPLRQLGRVWSGLVALVVCWVIGAVAYVLLVRPPETISGGVYGAQLAVLGVWQLLFFVVLRGWPFSTIKKRRYRLPTSNLVVIICAAGTYQILFHGVGLTPSQISSIAGSVIAAVLFVGMLFEAWPANRLSPLPGRTCGLILIAIIAIALHLGLSAYARQVHWLRATPDDWVTYATLNGLGIGIILHVAVWRRWPIAIRRGHHLPPP
jgi:hypothetical protein